MAALRSIMRLLSYNIHKGFGGLDRRYDLGRIVRVLEQQNPDVLCLQEVTQNARLTCGDDQPALLRAALVFTHFAYQMNVHYRHGGYGNLIVSRWPLTRLHQVSLNRGWRIPRGAQLAVIDTPEGPVHIAHFHLGLGEVERRWQAERLLSHPLFREGKDLPTLIVGDSNDWRNRLGAGPFVAHGFSPVTMPPSRFRSFPAFLPALSLDKAFQRGLFIRAAAVVRTRLAHRASDHLPLEIDFHLHETKWS